MPLLKKRMYAKKWFTSDGLFNRLYPSSVQAMAPWHWTPLNVAGKVADFLAAENNVRILDIGSGVGKFCLSAAFYKPKSFYYGIEPRENLISHAETAREIFHFQNVFFIHGNITLLDFKNFDHFYFYNAFYENLIGTDKIDGSIYHSGELYNYYNSYLYKQLEQKPAGTRLATFHSMEDEVPPSYHIVGTSFGDLLKFWIKT